MNPPPKRAVKVESAPERAPEPNPIVRFLETMTDEEAKRADRFVELGREHDDEPTPKP